MDIYLDSDAHKVFPQVLHAVRRHALELYVATRDYLAVDAGVHLILVEDPQVNRGAWIAGNILRSDICVTGDPELAAACILKGAVALSRSGRQWGVNPVNDDFRSAEIWPQDNRHFAERLEKTIVASRAGTARAHAAAAERPRPGGGAILYPARIAAG